MFTTFLAMFAGLVFGFVGFGPLGGALGVALGAVCGLLLAGSRSAVQQPSAGATLVHEQQRLLCVPKGQVATATFVRDANDGRWLDVERCSLCTPEQEVGCEKRCLHLMRDTLSPRKHRVHLPDPEPVA